MNFGSCGLTDASVTEIIEALAVPGGGEGQEDGLCVCLTLYGNKITAAASSSPAVAKYCARTKTGV